MLLFPSYFPFSKWKLADFHSELWKWDVQRERENDKITNKHSKMIWSAKHSWISESSGQAYERGGKRGWDGLNTVKYLTDFSLEDRSSDLIFQWNSFCKVLVLKKKKKRKKISYIGNSYTPKFKI